MQEGPPLLQLCGLSKHYGGQHVLADISFALHTGEVLGLIGPNGAGTTTLLEAIAGLTPADGGAVLWQGATTTMAERRRHLFYLPDGLRPWEEQHLARVVGFFAAVHARSDQTLATVVQTLGLAPVLRQRVATLSKGYARRLMLALAWLTPQPLLLMDEPFDGFDLRQTRDIMRVLREVAGAGRTLVLAIHQLSDAERVCDRFVLLAGGRVRGLGTLAELRAETHLATAGLEEIFLALT
ncbi:MAG: ABC transporter ATP-binding protein [Hyphomicrobiales bacterium]|nr:ABC transporter ATP-binding protein [Hyphomicrobiales bacterium]